MPLLLLAAVVAVVAVVAVAAVVVADVVADGCSVFFVFVVVASSAVGT